MRVKKKFRIELAGHANLFFPCIRIFDAYLLFTELKQVFVLLGCEGQSLAENYKRQELKLDLTKIDHHSIH